MARLECDALLRSIAIFWLLVPLASLAASQTEFGAAFYSMRWISLGACAASAWLSWMSTKTVRLGFVKFRVAIYLAAWTITVLASDHPLFSSYRFGVHSAIVVTTLIFLPEIMRLREYSVLLVSLKVMIAVILVVSYLRPAPMTGFDNPEYFRGILGNPNAFGHMAAVGAILFVHGFLTASNALWRQVNGGLAALALVLLVNSGARSSFIAASAGFFVLYFYYRERLSNYVMLAVVGGLLALIALPSLPAEILRRVFKHDILENSDNVWDQLAASRHSVWERHIEGFLQRPLAGWGFGVDADTNLTGWNGEFASTGFTGRDPVNDTLYSLESGGVIGVMAYFLLVALLFRAWRSKSEPRNPAMADESFIRDQGLKKQLHVAFLALACAMAVLFQFDNTALAAGNFFAALFWVTLGASVTLAVSLASDARWARSHHTFRAYGMPARQRLH